MRHFSYLPLGLPTPIKFECYIREQECSGLLHFEQGCYYLCQNLRSGDSCNNKHGFKYSWNIGQGRKDNLSNSDVTNLHLDLPEVVETITTEIILSKRLYTLITQQVDVSLTSEVNGEKVKHSSSVMAVLRIICNGDHLTVATNKETISNYFDIRDGVVSYQTTPIEYNDAGKWKREGRQTMKISKFLDLVRDYFVVSNPNINNQKAINRAIEILTAKSKTSTADILVSDDVGEIYKMETAKSGVGTLGGSCMNAEAGNTGSSFVESYNNIRGLKIAYLKKDDALIARALLWHDIETKNGSINFMDRIYGTEQNIETFKDWALENGYYHKVEQSYSNEELMNDDRKVDTFWLKDAFVNDVDGMPYVDTMCLYDRNDNILYSYDSDVRNCINLQTTDGYFDDDDEDCSYCDSCGDREHNDDLYYHVDTDRYLCESCRGAYIDSYTEQDGWYENYNEVRINGYLAYVPYNWEFYNYDLEYIESRDGYYDVDNTFSCDECEEYFHNDDAHTVETEDGETITMCESCYNEYMKQKELDEQTIKQTEDVQ